MKMNVSFETDLKDGQVLAAYLTIRPGKAHRTVEIREGVCYADEDRNGKLLGIELLAPGQVRVELRRVARKYGIRGMTKAVRGIEQALKVA